MKHNKSEPENPWASLAYSRPRKADLADSSALNDQIFNLSPKPAPKPARAANKKPKRLPPELKETIRKTNKKAPQSGFAMLARKMGAFTIKGLVASSILAGGLTWYTSQNNDSAHTAPTQTASLSSAFNPISLPTPASERPVISVVPSIERLAPSSPDLTQPESVLESFAYDANSSITLNPNLITRIENSASARNIFATIKEKCDASPILPWRMCVNQLFNESNHFNMEIITGARASPKGAIGLAQFTPGTARDLKIPRAELLNPNTAIDHYIARMEYLYEHFNGDMTLTLIGYNGGIGAPDAIREMMSNPNANGDEIHNFLNERYERLGNTGSHAYHVETRKYIGFAYGTSDDYFENPALTTALNNRLNDPLFVASLLTTQPEMQNAIRLAQLETQAVPLPRTPPLRPEYFNQHASAYTAPAAMPEMDEGQAQIASIISQNMPNTP